MITLFCNDTLEYCKNYGIDVVKMQTSEYDWWVAKNHTSNDGKGLLFNKFENKAPDYLYKVRFLDTPSAWSGEGKTGHTIDVNASGRKTKKVDW